MLHHSFRGRRCGGKRQRSGVAAVELALLAPILFALTIGTLDICSLIFLKETAVLAAYEGARRGVGRGRTNADATDRVLEFLDERNIDYSAADVVSISSPGFDHAETLENVTVTVTVPTEGNLLIASQFLGELNVSASVTMRKEFQNLNP